MVKIFIESKSIIIIPNRKTGLMSIADSLSSSGMFSRPEHEHAYSRGTLGPENHPKYFIPEIAWPQTEYVIDESVVSKNKIYLTARNPFDKMVSSYFYLGKGLEVFGREVDFASFVKMLVSEEISFYSTMHTVVPSTDMVTFQGKVIDFSPIKFETLKEDFYSLCLENNMDSYKKFKHVNKSPLRPSSDYRSLYNKETREIVEKMFEKDIEYFKYKF